MILHRRHQIESYFTGGHSSCAGDLRWLIRDTLITIRHPEAFALDSSSPQAPERRSTALAGGTEHRHTVGYFAIVPRAQPHFDFINPTHFGELFDVLEDVVAWIKDREGRYVWVNRAFRNNYPLDHS